MTAFKTYRFPVFIFSSLFFIFFLCIKGLVVKRTIIIKNKSIAMSSMGRWGAFSYDLEITDKTSGRKYVKTYRNFCISNLFFDLDEIKKAPEIYLAIPASELNKLGEVDFYSVTLHPVSSFGLFFRMLSYLVSTMPYVFLAPVIISGILFQKEFDKDYQYQSQLHKKTFTASFYIIIMLAVTSAIY